MKTFTFFVLLTSNCISADTMDTDLLSSESSPTNLMHSGTSSPTDTLAPEVVHSIFEYHGNQWTFDEIDTLNSNDIIKCFETLIEEGDGDITDIVQDMINRNILGNDNRGFDKLVLKSEILLKDYLKEQLAKIHDRQQAEIMAQETEQ